MCEADFAAVSLRISTRDERMVFCIFRVQFSSIPRLRGLQIYTQNERFATSSARAVADANSARHSNITMSRVP